MTQVVVLTGAGISRESGLKTFRDEDGLWAGHRVQDVCTSDAWERHPARVLDFYNMRRGEVLAAQPNAGHLALARLEERYRVTLITQNVDDLHERAGSTNIIHLHGEVLKCRSDCDEEHVVEWNADCNYGDLAPDGAQYRPHIVFFGERPLRWEEAEEEAERADIFLVIGTSLQVYPAANLVDITRSREIVLIDPKPSPYFRGRVVAAPATIGVPAVVEELLARPDTPAS